MILSISGASGAGKSSLAKELLALLPSASLSPGWSTRAVRPSETAADVRHVSPDLFEEMRTRGDFLWALEVHGNWYGILRQTVADGLTSEHSWTLLALTPDVLLTLRDFAEKNERRQSLKLLYVLSPEREVLRARLAERETSPEVIERRLADCVKWDEAAVSSGLYDLIIPGYGDLMANAHSVLADLTRG